MMTVIIGHASIDENKKISGGKAGDQTGKEVCTRTWYQSTWRYVLRCKDPSKAEAMAQACEKGCNNNNIGYDQGQRNSLRIQARINNYDLSKIATPCECDCSSFMAVCAECAGILVPYNGSNAPTTATMQSAFYKTGMFEVLTDSKYLTRDTYLRRGDILVKSGHTVMILGNGSGSTAQVLAPGSKYKVGGTYTLGANLYIRDEPFGEKMKFSCITKDAQLHAYFDEYGCAILKKGTRVSCKAVKEQTASTWILIPSGWVCAVNKDKIYIS